MKNSEQSKSLMPAALLEAHGRDYFTWKEANIHFATLNAAAKRGLLNKSADGKYSVSDKGAVFARIAQAVQGKDYFVLREPGACLGMLCSLKGFDILDCWEKPFDFSPAVELKVF